MFKSFITHAKSIAKDTSLWLSFFAGLSLVFSYAPFSFWWVSVIVIPAWFYHLQRLSQVAKTRTTTIITKHFYIFGFGWFASGISWVHVSIAEFGGMPLIASLLLMLLLCLYLAIFSGLAGYLTAKVSSYFSNESTHSPLNLWLLPPIWLFSEFLRSWVLTGFPWLSLGYGQIDGPLAVFAPVIGEIGITFVLLLLCVSLTQLALKKNLKTSACGIVFICVSMFLLHSKAWVTPTDKITKTALVQGNIKQSIKWEPEEQWPTMLKYLDLSRINYDADLIIWPESAIPAIEVMSITQEFLDMANRSAALNNSAIITGIINYNFESKEYFNSLIVLGNNEQDDKTGGYFYNNANRYYKNHLLPIGEFVPFGDLLRPLAPFFNLPMSSFTRGNYQQQNLRANGLNILPLICFEIAFPEQLAANFSNSSDILLTVSNDAWFGDSHGPHQHMEIARMRALEFGRPLLRSTNNGVTAITDHQGKITHQLPQFEEAVLKADIVLVQGRTPYSLYGPYPIWGISLLLLAGIWLKNYRRSH